MGRIFHTMASIAANSLLSVSSCIILVLLASQGHQVHSEMLQVGQNHQFLLCPVDEYGPVFQHRPAGDFWWHLIAYGDQKRPGTTDRLKVKPLESIDGVKYISYALENLTSSDAGEFKCEYDDNSIPQPVQSLENPDSVANVGDSFTFSPCPKGRYNPSFKFRPAGGRKFIFYSYGTTKTPDAPNRLEAQLVNGDDGDYISYTLKDLKKEDSGWYGCITVGPVRGAQYLTVQD